MKTTTKSSLFAAALLVGGATSARAQAPSSASFNPPSDTRERNASPLDPPTEQPPDARVAPEASDTTSGNVNPISPLAAPAPAPTPWTANGTALHSSWRTPEPAPSNRETYGIGRSGDERGLSRIGAGVLLGGGVEDFTNSNLRGMTTSGGFWNARLVAGTRQFFGLEAAYTGAARGIDALGLGQNARLVSNGAEGALRGNLPIRVGRSLLEPFVLVGLGWQHYNLTNTSTNTSDVADRDDIMTLPVGTGFEYSYGRFLADARVMYRRTYYNDLLHTSGGNLNNLSVGTQVGMMF